MAAVSFRPILQFDRGLEGVFDAFGEEVFLPSAVGFSPAELNFSGQINAFLSPPTIDDFLRQRLAPDVNQALLAPHVFNDLVEKSVAAIRRSRFTPRAAKVADILENDLSLRDLLLQYRNALLKG